jgi:hypothetical protein
LGDQAVGLYADKERSGGRLAFDRTAATQGDPAQPVEIGIYCLTFPNVGDDVKYLWVLSENTAVTAHPRCVELNDRQPIRSGKASDLVLLPKDTALLGMDTASNFIAAAIETSTIRLFTGYYLTPEEGTNALQGELHSLLLEAQREEKLRFILKGVPEYFQPAIKQREYLSTITKSFLAGIEKIEK